MGGRGHPLIPDDTIESLGRLARAGMTYALAAGFDRFTHDLRSPLQALIMAGDGLLDPSASDHSTREAMVRMLRQSTHRVEETLQSMQLPDFGDVQPAALSVAELVDEVLGYWPLKRHLRQARPQLELAGDLPPACMPRGILLHALLQLLLNAVESGGGKSLRILGGQEGDGLVLRVVDAGPGLSDAARAHLYEPFWTDKSPAGHLGVGLATSRGLLRHAGAALELETSTPGETRFALRLPGMPLG